MLPLGCSRCTYKSRLGFRRDLLCLYLMLAPRCCLGPIGYPGWEQPLWLGEGSLLLAQHHCQGAGGAEHAANFSGLITVPKVVVQSARRF